MKLNKKYIEIFDKIQTVPDLADYIVDCHKELLAVISKNRDREETYTYIQMRQDAWRVASWLAQQSVFGQHMAIIGNLCYEWFVIFFGVLASGNVVVPIDRELNESDMAKLLRQGDVTHLFLEGTSSHKANNLETSVETINTLILYGEDCESNMARNLRQYMEAQPIPDPRVSHNDLPVSIAPLDSAMMVFTSGTTGDSKAVMLSHKNICDNLCCSLHFLQDVHFTAGERIIPVLPPHHMFELTTGLLAPLFYGGSICFGGGLKYISKNVKYFQPVGMILVPMVAEGLYKKICLEISRKGKEKQMERFIRISNRLLTWKIDLRRWLFKDIHEVFGGKMRVIVCGGAFLEPDLLRRFNEWGLSMRNGYGITECSPVVSCNMAKSQKAGSIGILPPSRYCQVKISDGEILVRGSIVMKEYYKDLEATADAFVEGWFKTGDLGYLDDEGFLFLTGRKKNLIVLADGNNISPEELENHLEKLPLVKSIMVCEKKHQQTMLVTACIFPDQEYAKEAGITDIQAELERETAAYNATLPPHKRVQKIEMVAEDFEKTALGKIKRYKFEGGRETHEWTNNQGPSH
ncbi:MAG: AMP-binding protein [Peptococcaceae bacterium]|nr:AMP-binding protein [Peptococcaceae bacterium]